uniref:MIF4G domain-containing protein n=1 Tax=viral metagenome TaxID=1070528 RepID=A0A6C0I4D9_9ZZZZ
MAFTYVSSMTLIQYTIDDYTKHLFDGFDYALPLETTNILENLLKQLNIVDSNTSSVDHTKQRPQKSRVGPVSGSGEWNRSKPFKTTLIEKKEGLEKTINDIRYCLNNISEKNYQMQVQKIMDNLTMIPASSYEQVVQYIIDNAIINKLNSSLYAELLSKVIDVYPEFLPYVLRLPSEYIVGIKQIVCLSSSEDFELFCSVNKTNDQRKGMVHFLVHLHKLGKLADDKEIENIIQLLIDMIQVWKLEPDKMNEVDELTENLFLFVSISAKLGSTSLPVIIQEISKYLPRQYPGLSSRAIFKFMDMNSILGKNG